MTIEFQKDVVKYLCQRKDAKKYIEIINDDFFDGADEYVVFALLKSFVQEYHSQPSLGNLLEFFHKELRKKKEKLPADLVNSSEEAIRTAFEVLTANVDQIREIIIEEYQFKLTKDLFIENAAKVKQKDPEVIKDMFRKLSDIKKLGETDLDEEKKNRGTFLLKDHSNDDYDDTEGHPTNLRAINRMTSTGGFYCPQLIVIMSGPKGFKTGTLLNLAKGYVQDGYKVYYADAENGHVRLKHRVRQAMLNCTYNELRSGVMDDTLDQMVTKYMALGGDFKADFYPAHTKTIHDVEIELEYLRDEHGWVPDIICYDYLDLFKPIDSSIKEKRLKIQACYFDAIALQNKWGMFGFTLSQVNKEAINKRIIDITAFSEDFGKAANAHAAFAFCRDKVEKELGIGRLLPVMQRDGVAQESNKACFVKVEEGKMLMEEIKYKEWQEIYDSAKKENSKVRRVKGNGRPKKNLKDD